MAKNIAIYQFINLDFEDEVFIKFSIEKTLKWLSLKFETIKKSLIDQGIGKNLFGFKISDYVSGNKFSEGTFTLIFLLCSCIRLMVVVAFSLPAQLRLPMPLVTYR